MNEDRNEKNRFSKFILVIVTIIFLSAGSFSAYKIFFSKSESGDSPTKTISVTPTVETSIPVYVSLVPSNTGLPINPTPTASVKISVTQHPSPTPTVKPSPTEKPLISTIAPSNSPPPKSSELPDAGFGIPTYIILFLGLILILPAIIL